MSEEMNLQLANMSSSYNIGADKLQFGKITINEDYCKKWHIHSKDFVCLIKNGELLRNTLYRIGGLNYPKLNKDEYFMLIKHVEAFYSADIMKMSKSKDNRHLEGRWCILDKAGNEKVEFQTFESPYLVSNSCIYSINSKYYNIETGEFYGNTSSSIESSEFLFLENKYNTDEANRGVKKINKKDGSWELFK